jgi:hypothetical protein
MTATAIRITRRTLKAYVALSVRPRTPIGVW